MTSNNQQLPPDVNDNEPSFISKLFMSLQNKGQRYLDMSVPHLSLRWIVFSVMIILYAYRVYVLRGFYIVTYGLGIFLLNQLIGFLSPLDEDQGPGLPTSNVDEFKPFIRRLPEFKFWYSCSKSVFIAFCMTFFSLFNIPVFWPILLVYFIVLFFLTMKRQIKHMIKHKYVPFTYGKKKYGKQKSEAPSSLGLGNIVSGAKDNK